jgi:plastocyanin
MRRLAISICLCLGLVLAAMPAQAADQSVGTTADNAWSPSTVNIGIGERVTWTNTSGGFHSLVFDDGTFTYPSSPSATNWTTSRTFPNAGTYKFHCGFHGQAMAGSVTVQQILGGPPDSTPPQITKLKIVPSTFCNKKTKTCKTTGATVDFTISEDARIAGRIIRLSDNKRVGGLTNDVTAGDSEFDLAATGLKLGKYRLELTPKDDAGNKPAKPYRVGFKIATKRG